MDLSRFQLSPRQLRQVLAFDAVSGAATAVLQLALAGTLAAWFGLSETRVLALGWAFLGYVALAGWLARQPVPSRTGVMALVLANVAGAVVCLALAWGGGVTPLGQAYLTAIAVVVLVLADLEFLGWRALAPRPAM